ncbi:phosphopantetheinyl transferase (holo-ACP synthase) [Pedobacter sp. AK017]|uniref:4'-phosphopantetheinyl transferase family protein n=1 Tax=Pedobacter sp. AK017 TaxID=2723073 RepID=UPI00160A8545|nr:4'-phosphopantetheinyl transferase superfamily protein [Pedobacter sp. AK017]MBB5436627.1 phosphopantetheinyl transferase (holo-ACP synthase) [Pedobacter sp. AK017]
MIGNDIVDLEQAKKESNWKRKGYLEKIFTPGERFLISAAKDAEMMVWLLWTMKESAYKIFSRENKIRVFAPAAIVCNNLIIHKKTATGNVWYQEQSYFTKTSITERYIHTLAAADASLLQKIRYKISCYDACDSSYRATNPGSVSHHGIYLALAYL